MQVNQFFLLGQGTASTCKYRSYSALGKTKKNTTDIELSWEYQETLKYCSMDSKVTLIQCVCQEYISQPTAHSSTSFTQTTLQSHAV